MTQLMQQMAYRGTPHEPDAPTLELNEVSATYTAVSATAASNPSAALQTVSFRAERGEQMAIIGPNGAGKSTLFKLIAGMLKPTSGTIKMFGHDPDEHICIAYVPQRSQIDWTFPVTVEDVVMMGRVRQIGLFRRPRRSDWAHVRVCLERVGAEDLAGKQIGELSGGQQQRVFIARALAQEADLLLMDEPLSGLDMPSQELIFDILDSLRPDGVTVLVSTHDLTLAAERFDRIMLLNRRVIACGPPTAVLTTHNLLTAYGGEVAPAATTSVHP